MKWATCGCRCCRAVRATERRELQEAVIRHRLEKNPGDFEAHMNLGAVELSRLNAQAAVTELRNRGAHRTRARPEAHNMLGLALAATGRNSEAIAQYALALRERPAYASARFNLATALAKAGQVDEAVKICAACWPDNPADVTAKERLCEVLTLRGMLAAAGWKTARRHVAQFDEALKLEPANEEARKYREQALGH